MMMLFIVYLLLFLIFLIFFMGIGGYITTRCLFENVYGGRDFLNVVFVLYGFVVVNIVFNVL